MTTKNDDVLIKVEGLHKIYGDFHALNGINEEIHKGEVVVVVGPSFMCSPADCMDFVSIKNK